MKTILSALALLASALLASAQYTTPPIVKSGIVTNTVYILAGGGSAPGPTTNIPAAHAVAVAVGTKGVGITLNIAGTNSVTTTNVTFVFQTSGDGVNWATNNDLTVNVTPTAGWTPVVTNILESAPNIGNLFFIRWKSASHTNLANVFVTNINYSTR